jgi:hypothetical protein
MIHLNLSFNIFAVIHPLLTVWLAVDGLVNVNQKFLSDLSHLSLSFFRIVKIITHINQNLKLHIKRYIFLRV